MSSIEATGWDELEDGVAEAAPGVRTIQVVSVEVVVLHLLHRGLAVGVIAIRCPSLKGLCVKVVPHRRPSTSTHRGRGRIDAHLGGRDVTDLAVI
jgi:hypothetical protein